MTHVDRSAHAADLFATRTIRMARGRSCRVRALITCSLSRLVPSRHLLGVQVMENLRALEHAPGVAMHEVPRPAPPRRLPSSLRRNAWLRVLFLSSHTLLRNHFIRHTHV
jgi:hypothetical protein